MKGSSRLAQLEPGARYYYTTSADDALGRGTVRSFVFPKRSSSTKTHTHTHTRARAFSSIV